jgi:hypothetical protein
LLQHELSSAVGGDNCFLVLHYFQDGEESVASWELRVEGRLMEDVSAANALYFQYFYPIFAIFAEKFLQHVM